MKKKFKFSNGDELKEKITGFQGVVTGISFYITGCNQYLLTAKSANNHTEAKTIWYDEGRLKLVRKAFTEKDVKSIDNGCDIQAPIK